ncbi:MAG: pyruvate dehydrogenase complex dihydrolipoamide acetyltransferase [Henriciella sp.]|jgi:pyruvate dehydrogenase E2 component (dihydrolipoamide acetyltransferase)|uniref:pyruvate dehydrogenase complex dihydrolipoamide acetyltransferase n=1 Tax=Henriciella sp. TaxID=1968823 RepID=UPI000C0F4ED5|nr:pyruvate dehydrogenase complex dihydrolipoamide acetyltransferase [Henriciella sp.]MAN75289.1 pyruvate dehydrogenase complex dihydrolipoamide acetyltransferase [Henriciella sp.]MBF33452.1 pyruvate dehydrogenase complex dihydrolipoamide acetyltransferase [Hyphomonadaceae bacterium]MBK75233.1 pyruvate dehydrogenase complex dihydrolipoamide acetyltransferase [Henriciella sp.]PHR79870.1 MAG: pyruvate dehydrogenase complex dihydrolipoamide acetyltransferase [Henriciella sp.]|tara:strand:- start:1288 stop:2718 length:1431 start_codon:yes stop_codon:yes gene_type:complete
MAINITMPALSPTMEEGTLARWMVKPGDTISSGDVIAEIETDKATMEVEAVDEGTIAKILVDAGTEGVKVNSVIALLAEEGEDPDEIEAPADTGAADDDSADAKDDEPKSESAESSPSKEQKPKESDPDRTTGKGETAQKPREAEGKDLTKELEGTPPKLADVGSGKDRIKASPLARRIAALRDIDLSTLEGSGPRGRIVKADVEAAEPGQKKSAQDTTKGDTPAAAPQAPDGLILPQVLDDRVYDPESYELKPLDGMRKTVAKRLTQSFMQVPHFPLNVDIKLDKLLASRADINEAAPEGVKISVNDMLIKASALALMSEPDCNASFTDKGIAYHKSAHISVAVAIDGGLITPVIRDAQTKGLATISREMKDLATRARERKLKPQEYAGGTFSISNLGMFGIKSFGSIINQPEGMILSVGAGEKRPVVDESGEIVPATVMTVTLSCDHRVIGGAEGAKWLAAFKRYVEHPQSMLL